jgi:hypothetical protein
MTEAGPAQPPVPPRTADAARGQDPARTARNFVGRVRGIVRLDLEGLDALPGGRWAVLGAVVLVTAAFSLARVGIRDLYTESIPFLILALAAGFLSRTTGMLLVATHVIFDLIRFLVGLGDPFSAGSLQTPEQIVGRLITYWLLWVLVVIIPTLQRVSHYAATDWLARRNAATIVAAPASAAVAGGFVYLWSTAEPFLIRPAFAGSPTVEAMEPQRTGWLIALAAVGIATVIGIVLQRRVWTGADLIPLVRRTGAFDTGGLVMRLVAYAVTVVLLLGLITSVLDVVLLGAALIGGELIVPGIRRAEPMRSVLPRVPFLVRLALALGLTFLISHLWFNVFYEPFLGSEFFPIVVALAVSLVVFRVLVEASPVEPRVRPGPVAPTALVVILAAVGATLLVPPPVVADNCSGLSDCTIQDVSQVAVAVAAIAASLWTLFSNSLQKTPPTPPGPPPGPPDDFRKALGEGLGIPGEYISVQQHGDDFWKFQVRVRGDTPLPTGDTVQGWIDAGAVPEGYLTGADTLVVGSVQKSGDLTRVNVRTVDVETGVIGDAGKGTGPSLGEAAADAGESLGITWGTPASTGRVE